MTFMRITFLGGAGGVTGANHLLEVGKTRLLIDCGLFQSGHFVDDLNRSNFAFDPSGIDFVSITHGHLDHVGRLPKLYKEGFRGKIYATSPTIDIAHIILEDAFHIMSAEAEEHHKPLLYEFEDIGKVMELFEPREYRAPFRPAKNLTITFDDAGHILGSSLVSIVEARTRKKVVFSGDFGNKPKPILQDPTQIESADFAVVESAYGNRVHETHKSLHLALADIFLRVIKQRSILIIPAFSVERTQELLYYFNDFVEKHHFPSVATFVDSPMAIKITEVFKKYPQYFDEEAKALIQKGDDFLDFPGLIFTTTVQESKRIEKVRAPKIIIAGSGMMHAGRIRNHLLQYLSDKRTILLIVGFQVRGSLGRQLLDGARTVRIFGKKIPVRATIRELPAMSAHGDSNMLFEWVSQIKGLKKAFVVQGDPEAANALANRINAGTKAKAIAPGLGYSEEI
jgi:metallo-beta-lactamase family protein